MLQSKGLAQWRQLARRQFCANLHVTTPQEVQWKPPLRQAAGTLGASGRQRGENGKEPECYKQKPDKYKLNFKINFFIIWNVNFAK